MVALSTRRPYTTQLGAGLGLVDETKSLLTLYQPGMTAAELYDQALSSGLFPMVSARRLKNIVTDCFSPRYLKTGAAEYLKKLITPLPSVAFTQLLLYHTASVNSILHDFITEIYWSKYSGSHDSIDSEDAQNFVLAAVREGKTFKPWSDTMIKRVSSYLLGCCADYGLLSSGRVSKRTIQPVTIQQTTVLYLSHWLHFSKLSDNTNIHHEAWKLFGLEPIDVIEELKKLSKNGWMIVQSAGDITRISWQFKTMEDVIDVIVKS